MPEELLVTGIIVQKNQISRGITRLSKTIFRRLAGRNEQVSIVRHPAVNQEKINSAASAVINAVYSNKIKTEMNYLNQ